MGIIDIHVNRVYGTEVVDFGKVAECRTRIRETKKVSLPNGKKKLLIFMRSFVGPPGLEPGTKRL
jgi:hypothetical protein